MQTFANCSILKSNSEPSRVLPNYGVQEFPHFETGRRLLCEFERGFANLAYNTPTRVPPLAATEQPDFR